MELVAIVSERHSQSTSTVVEINHIDNSLSHVTINDGSESSARSLDVPEINPNSSGGSSTFLPDGQMIPIGILSDHVLQKKDLRQKLFFHIVVETLIATGTITIVKQIVAFPWIVWVTFFFVLLILFPLQLWKYRATIKTLDKKLQRELDSYLTLIRTHVRTNDNEYECDSLVLDSPPPTYAIAKEEPPAYFALWNSEDHRRVSSLLRDNRNIYANSFDQSVHTVDSSTHTPQVVYRTENTLERNSIDSDPPSYYNMNRLV